MATDNDYPQELAAWNADIDADAVIAAQYQQSDERAAEADVVSEIAALKPGRGKRVAMGVAVACLIVIASAAFMLFHHSAPVATATNPELADIQKRANAVPVKKAAAPKPAIVAPAPTPDPSSSTPPPSAAAAAQNAPVVPTPSPAAAPTAPPAPVAPPAPPAPAPTDNHAARPPVTTAVVEPQAGAEQPQVEPPLSAPAAASTAAQAQIAALSKQIDHLKAQVANQGRDIIEAKRHAKPGLPRGTVVTAALKDGVVLTLPTGRKVIVRTGDAIK